MEEVDGMELLMVDSDDRLAELSEQWQHSESLALDTEFMRTNTFYPKLGLLQVGDGQRCTLIDPLGINEWQPFLDLLQNPDIEIVVHSAGEDLNLLLTSFGCLPARLFDTQMAAAFLGMGFSLSYQALALELMDKEIDKGETRSDWLQRPLSDAQLRYAALDVRYLLQMRNMLAEELATTSKQIWFEEDCRQLLSTAREFESEDNWAMLYTGISNAWRLNARALAMLQRLCIWREHEARKKNRPRNWIAKDAELLILAHEASRWPGAELEKLLALKDIQPGLLKHRGRKLLEVMFAEEQASDEDNSLQAAPAPLSPEYRNLLKRLQQHTRNRAEALDMAPELLARKRQLLAMLDTGSTPPRLHWQGDMAGWRREQLEEGFSKVLADES
jgi:ribonuclease D